MKYLELKKKNVDPVFTLTGSTPMEVRMTWTKFDEDNQQTLGQADMLVELPRFLEDAKLAKKRWLAYKSLYESLTGETIND